MGWGTNDIYYQPEAFGIETFGEFQRSEPSYDFDIVLVSRDLETGMFYVNQDSGCSCPSPFEDFTSKYDLGEPLTAKQAATKVKSLVNESYDQQYAYRESQSVIARLNNL